MKVLHASDLHGRWEKFLDDAGAILEHAELVILSGDMLPNFYRGERVLDAIEQDTWLQTNEVARLVRRILSLKPTVIVNGNHDRIDLAQYVPASVRLTPGSVVEVGGLRFAGFEGINMIAGEWEGELPVAELSRRVTDTCFLACDVLVTHAPPAGILDQVEGYGLRSLGNVLAFRSEDVSFRHHFFGHCHTNGGQQEVVDGRKFYNGAASVLLHEVT